MSNRVHRRLRSYLTMRVRLTVRVKPLLEAEATIVYVPAGVTGTIGGFGLDPPSRGIVRPTPHPAAAMRHASTIRPPIHRRPSFCKVNRLIGTNIANQIMPSRFGCGRSAEDVAVTPVRIVTETVVVLPSVTLEGVTVQVALAGTPVQEKLAVPETFAAELSSRGKTAFCPVVMVRLVPPFGFRLKSTPVPVSDNV